MSDNPECTPQANNTKKPAPKPPIQLDPGVHKVVFIVIAASCLTPFITPPLALLLGLIVANTIGNPFPKQSSKTSKLLLKASVVGLGFGMTLQSAIKASGQGIILTISTILGTFILGALLAKLLKMDKKASYLISSGTAICGGSAIAAVAPIVNADDKQISVALGTVFTLNAIALFLFPAIGHALELSQTQFGLWSAIAIHDTSSVVGAAGRYGTEALTIATTVKLARALWIIPLSLITAVIYKQSSGKINIPWFIGLFILATIVNTYVPGMDAIAPYIIKAAKAGLTLTLFLIGAGLSLSTLKAVGIKPLIQGIILWIAISVTSLWVIVNFIA